MSKRIQLAFLGAVALIAAGAVSAKEPWNYVGGEAAWAFAPTATQTTAAQADSRAARPNVEVTADGWQFVGGEAGWIAASHEYDFQSGTLAHSHQAWCVASHDTPAAAKPSASDLLELRRDYGGA
jgi:hypothetical protein